MCVCVCHCVCVCVCVCVRVFKRKLVHCLGQMSNFRVTVSFCVAGVEQLSVFYLWLILWLIMSIIGSLLSKRFSPPPHIFSSQWTHQRIKTARPTGIT
jgi:hypothetical protein